LPNLELTPLKFCITRDATDILRLRTRMVTHLVTHGDACRRGRQAAYREREYLVKECTRLVNRMKDALARLGIRKFRPTLRNAAEPKNAKVNICLELDEEAIQYIVRALTNLAVHDGSQPSEGPRFWNWIDPV
jgi:hypothetical protein